MTQAIPAQTLVAGQRAAFYLPSYFSDPDGDTLTHTAGVADTGVAVAEVMGDTLTIRGVRQGSTTVTVTASDPDGLSASQSVAVTVVNQPPAVSDSIPAQTLVAGQRAAFYLPSYFSDPDGDTLTHTAGVADTGVAVAEVMGDTLTILGVRQGSTTVTVTASDPDGLSASQSVAVTVVNQPPAVSDSIPAQTLVAGQRAAFSLPSYFSDPDGDTLTHTAGVADTGVAVAEVMGDTLTIRGVRQGKHDGYGHGVRPGRVVRQPERRGDGGSESRT